MDHLVPLPKTPAKPAEWRTIQSKSHESGAKDAGARFVRFWRAKVQVAPASKIFDLLEDFA
jgi:hypothetical protein